MKRRRVAQQVGWVTNPLGLIRPLIGVGLAAALIMTPYASSLASDGTQQRGVPDFGIILHDDGGQSFTDADS
jgi:hypothetical protein